MAFLKGADGALLQGADQYFLTDGMPGSDFDWTTTVISQYVTDPVVMALIGGFADAMDQSGNIAQFFDLIWNIDSAEGYGLDMWGRILGLSRSLIILPSDYFGTAEGGYMPFGDGPLYSGVFAPDATDMTDVQYKRLLLVKAAVNIGDSSASTVNGLLHQIFGPERICYVEDLGNMIMVLTFEFDMEAWESAAISQTGIIPRPSGVDLFTMELDPSTRFGFAEGGYVGFADGTFYGDPIHAIQ